MADLEDFFKKKDKKKKGEKKFATVNTDELAKNLDQMAVKEEMARKKEISESCSRRAEVSFQSNKNKLGEQVITEREVKETDLKMSGKNVGHKKNLNYFYCLFVVFLSCLAIGIYHFVVVPVGEHHPLGHPSCA